MTTTSEKKPKQLETPEQPSSNNNFLQSVLKEIAEFKGWEYIFQVLLYGFIMWALYNAKIIYDFHNSPKWAHIPKLSVYDFKYSLIVVAILVGYKHLCQKIFFPVMKKILDPTRYASEEELNKRASSGCSWIGNLIYYTFSSLAAFFLFRDQYFFPKVLGGSGEPGDMFRNMPYYNDVPYGVEFYMVQFGCHLHTLIDYVVYRWRDVKFWEMFLHHSIAVFLIFFSYATNNIPVGIMVLFVHDPCDVFLYINRLFSETKRIPIFIRAAVYIAFMAIWLFLRLFVFPKYIVSAGFTYIASNDSGILYSPYLFLTLMLSALVILHCYWFVFIVRLIVNMARGKSDYNVYDSHKRKKKA